MSLKRQTRDSNAEYPHSPAVSVLMLTVELVKACEVRLNLSSGPLATMSGKVCAELGAACSRNSLTVDTFSTSAIDPFPI